MLFKSYIHTISAYIFAASFWQTIWHALESIDKKLFLKINTQYTSGFLDALCPLLRETNFWLPVYIFLMLFVIVNFGKKSIAFLVFVALTITIADQTSSAFLKNAINRTRPGNDITMQAFVIKRVVYYPQSGSFTSSHATNHFALAMFLFATLQPYFKKWGWLLFAWAAIISYAQVYVGVHYPLDVLGGALLGIAIGAFTAWLYHKWFSLRTTVITR